MQRIPKDQSMAPATEPSQLPSSRRHQPSVQDFTRRLSFDGHETAASDPDRAEKMAQLQALLAERDRLQQMAQQLAATRQAHDSTPTRAKSQEESARLNLSSTSNGSQQKPASAPSPLTSGLRDQLEDSQEGEEINWETVELLHNMPEEVLSTLAAHVQQSVRSMRTKFSDLLERQKQLDTLRSQMNLLHQVEDSQRQLTQPHPMEIEEVDSDDEDFDPNDDEEGNEGEEEGEEDEGEEEDDEEGYHPQMDLLERLEDILQEAEQSGADPAKVNKLREQYEALKALRQEAARLTTIKDHMLAQSNSAGGKTHEDDEEEEEEVEDEQAYLDQARQMEDMQRELRRLQELKATLQQRVAEQEAHQSQEPTDRMRAMLQEAQLQSESLNRLRDSLPTEDAPAASSQAAERELEEESAKQEELRALLQQKLAQLQALQAQAASLQEKKEAIERQQVEAASNLSVAPSSQQAFSDGASINGVSSEPEPSDVHQLQQLFERLQLLKGLSSDLSEFLPGRVSPRSGSVSLAPNTNMTNMTSQDRMAEVNGLFETEDANSQQYMNGFVPTDEEQIEAYDAVESVLAAQLVQSLEGITSQTYDDDFEDETDDDVEELQDEDGMPDLEDDDDLEVPSLDEDIQHAFSSAAYKNAHGHHVHHGHDGDHDDDRAKPRRHDSLMVDLGALRQRTMDLYDKLQETRERSVEEGDEEESTFEPDTRASREEQASDRRAEEVHNFNLAMAFAESLDRQDKKDFLAMFFSRFKESPYGAFSDAAEAFSLISADIQGQTAVVNQSVDVGVGPTDQGHVSEYTLNSNAPSVSLFDALRDSIYEQVSTFISENEARPEFLIQLFSLIQELDNDYLRQKALRDLQSLTENFLSTSTHQPDIETLEYDEEDDDMDSQVQELLQNSLTRSRFLQQEARSTQQPHANTSYQGDYDELVSAPSASSVDSNGGKEQVDEDGDDEQPATRTPRPLASLLSDLAISNLTENSPLMADEFRPEMTLYFQIMDAVRDILSFEQDEPATLSQEVVDALCSVVEATISVSNEESKEEPQFPIAAAAEGSTENESLVTLAVRGIFGKYKNQELDESTKALLMKDLEDVLYDEMIFDHIIEQVDGSYADELEELRRMLEDLRGEESRLMRQRLKDMKKLREERLTRYQSVVFADQACLQAEKSFESEASSVEEDINCEADGDDDSADDTLEEDNGQEEEEDDDDEDDDDDDGEEDEDLTNGQTFQFTQSELGEESEEDDDEVTDYISLDDLPEDFYVDPAMMAELIQKSQREGMYVATPDEFARASDMR